MKRKISNLDGYKVSRPSLPVAEDTEKCIKTFGNAYEMVVYAAERARKIASENRTPYTVGHKPAVQALLEVQEGKLTKETVPMLGTYR